MKKHFLALATLVAMSSYAQEYNKWSIDVNAGVHKPTMGVGVGHRTTTPSFWTANAGVRYMLNNKFGIRLAGGYDDFKNAEKTPDFASKLWNVNLQGVVNVGRVLSFENWTRDLGLLLHSGFGYGRLSSDKMNDADQIGFLTVGVTPQLRLSNRITLLGDGSVYFNARQQKSFDTNSNNASRRGIQGTNFTVTLGLQVALGKHSVHADWYATPNMEKELSERLLRAERELANLNERLANKAEKMIDTNNNNIPDEIEEFLNSKYGNLDANHLNGLDVARELIQKGYINVYFDFNSSNPQVSSLWAADFIANFLKRNPSTSVNVVAYADEIGGENYNQTLSAKRADIVKQLLIDRGVEASRLSSVGKGEDTTVNKNSKNARQLARRATFELK